MNIVNSMESGHSAPVINPSFPPSYFNVSTPSVITGNVISDSDPNPDTAAILSTGTNVMFNNFILHKSLPDFFPELHTIGSVVRSDSQHCLVQWPEGSTSYDDLWEVDRKDIKVCAQEEN